MKPSISYFEPFATGQRGSALPLKRHYLGATRLIFLLMCIGLGAGVMAQTPDHAKTQTPVKKEVAKKQDMKHLRSDVRERQAASHQVNHDLSHVRFSKAMHDHKAVARANKKEDIDAKRLELKGVGHPVVKAKRQVKVQDDNRKDHM